MNGKILATVLSVGMLMISSVTVFAENPHDRDEGPAGAVYAMTNAPDGNNVVVFDRDEDGILTKVGSIPTGGTGSGGGLDPLGSQNALVLSRDNRWLLAVNGGSNEISVFRVLPDGLKWIEKVDSGGDFPVSLTVNHDLVYVLNAGASPNITGFTLGHKGRLTPLASSTRALGSGAFAQVGFDPDGERLVVTDKAGSQIFVYSVSDDGLPAVSPVVSSSNGNTPFGFIFDRRGRLVVVEVGPNAVSSYKILKDDTLHVISGSVPNGQQAACWIVGDGRGDVFTANPGSGTVSAYQLSARSGRVSLLNGAAGSGLNPLDLAVAANGRFLYALDPGRGSIDMFRIKRDGGLTDLGVIDGTLSLFAQGIAAR
ncbi:MAG TPA: beta-propeller fold lactonase family protein [Nitrospiria bacterium]|jgi:6-phosphogluconolactonase (cycloisomerase 2 family)|nr:beta-propeller fold lactonase family protein [Nitrospiria bacterium]